MALICVHKIYSIPPVIEAEQISIEEVENMLKTDHADPRVSMATVFVNQESRERYNVKFSRNSSSD